MPSNNPLNRAGVVKAATISAGKYIGATAGRIGEAILGTTRAKQSIVYQQLSHQNAMKRLETYHELALDRIGAEKKRQSDILGAKTKAGEESSRRRSEQAAKNAAAREQAARNKPKAQGPTADIIALRKADVAGDGVMSSKQAMSHRGYAMAFQRFQSANPKASETDFLNQHTMMGNKSRRQNPGDNRTNNFNDAGGVSNG